MLSFVQITKLFGVNYDTPTGGEPIHASCSQLSAPGSYMLAPSYSEALLMEPASGTDTAESNLVESSGMVKFKLGRSRYYLAKY